MLAVAVDLEVDNKGVGEGSWLLSCSFSQTQRLFLSISTHQHCKAVLLREYPFIKFLFATKLQNIWSTFTSKMKVFNYFTVYLQGG